MSAFVVSLIRTWVPMGVGWLASVGLLPADLSDEAVLTFGALISGAFYLLVRLLESKWSWAGWLLGSPKAPTYPS